MPHQEINFMDKTRDRLATSRGSDFAQGLDLDKSDEMNF